MTKFLFQFFRKNIKRNNKCFWCDHYGDGVCDSEILASRCNGYYSNSFPLNMEENNESKRTN
jgi:hypothetical protein